MLCCTRSGLFWVTFKRMDSPSYCGLPTAKAGCRNVTHHQCTGLRLKDTPKDIVSDLRCSAASGLGAAYDQQKLGK